MILNQSTLQWSIELKNHVSIYFEVIKSENCELKISTCSHLIKYSVSKSQN